MFTFLQIQTPKVVKRTSKVVKRTWSSTKQCPQPPTKQYPPLIDANRPTCHKDGGYKMYKYMTFLVGLPAILAVGAFTFIQKKSRECEERPPFVPYETMRRRTKRFPWGDGNKSLFHNPEINALPEGYEGEIQCECGNKEDSEEESTCKE